MAKVQQAHSGRFTLRSHGELMGDGKFQPAFVATEHKPDGDEDSNGFTGQAFDTEEAAEEAGMEAAFAWLEKYRPVNG